MSTAWNTLLGGTIPILVMAAGYLELMFLHKNFIKNSKVYYKKRYYENANLTLEPFVAVVIDPIRTMATNKVNIESFRTYPDGYKPSISDDQVLVLS